MVFDMKHRNRRIYNPKYNNKGRLVRLSTADRSGPSVVHADAIGKFNRAFERKLQAIREQLTTQQEGEKDATGHSA